MLRKGEIALANGFSTCAWGVLTLITAIDKVRIVLDVLGGALVAIEGNGTFEALFPHVTLLITGSAFYEICQLLLSQDAF